jgi:cytidylate kinase
MPTIAMTQEMGSLSKDVALQLTQTMNLTVLRHEMADHVAGKMRIPTSLINRLREGKAGLVERMSTDQERLALYTAEQVLELANRGQVVLRGWGATCLLRSVPHVVCIRVTRSFKKRVEWLMENLEIDDREFAEAEIRRSDEAHASRMHQQFGVTWGDPLLYDLVLNTDRLTVESCVEQIRLLAGRPEFQESPESHAILANLTLETQIRAALRKQVATQNTNVSIESRSGKVTLRGIVLNAHERTETEKIATALAGVHSVANELRLMTNSRQFVAARNY